MNRIEHDGWIRFKLKDKGIRSIIEYIKEILEAKNKYFNHPSDIFSREFNWFNYYNQLNLRQKKIIDALKDKSDWRRVFLVYYLNLLLVQNASTELPTNEEQTLVLSQEIRGFSMEQIQFIDDSWTKSQLAAKLDFEMNHPDLLVKNIYNKRSSQKQRRLSLRQIIKFDAGLFTSYFPVLLVTPDVCSNLFKGMNRYFDIVLFDEASQLRLEDNLPALLKGKQLIIAGDEHQMPPSNYFNKIFEGSIDDVEDIEDEVEVKISRDDVLLSCESLLDFATELEFHKKHLDFHYRSKHPHLIDFSNYAFYEQRLKPIPTQLEYSPIAFLSINGTYENHCNDLEADAVLRILENDIKKLDNGEYPSVGIATFNITQRDLIKNKILERIKLETNSEFSNKILALKEQGLFVKNLENIQGDERDIIIISTTYGPTQDGSFSQRFGPINHVKGYKLLNVIITRAKYKIYICSSIPDQIIHGFKDYLSKEGSNNRKAVLFAYLAYAKGVSENDNRLRNGVLEALSENASVSSLYRVDHFNSLLPFEKMVYRYLSEQYKNLLIIPKMQFAGFQIEIIIDSKIEGIPRIAIECDGTDKHHSNEAYLYDIHKREILEENGIVLHRIWSVNWWRDLQGEQKKLSEFINLHLSQKPFSKSLILDPLAKLFDQSTSIDLDRNDELTTAETRHDQADNLAIAIQTEAEEKRVSINSKVRIKYLNLEKDLLILLVGDDKLRDKNPGNYVETRIDSPLGRSLLGKAKWEIARVGDLDIYVKIMEILD